MGEPHKAAFSKTRPIQYGFPHTINVTAQRYVALFSSQVCFFLKKYPDVYLQHLNIILLIYTGVKEINMSLTSENRYYLKSVEEKSSVFHAHVLFNSKFPISIHSPDV